MVEVNRSPGAPDSLARRFDPRQNALNSLRLLLATLVIFGHAAPIGGYTLPAPLPGFFGEVAVDAFFGISGFLITRSWVRRPQWGRYLWHRGLRIMPAFWTCLAVTALLIAPVATVIQTGSFQGYWSAANGPFAYLWNNSLLWMGQFGISGGPSGIPYAGTWDGSLWSLYWEFLCYLAIGSLGVLGILHRRRWIVLLLFILFWMVAIVRTAVPDLGASYFDTNRVESIFRLGLMFLAGSVAYLYAERVPIRGWLAGLALILFGVGIFAIGDYRAVGGPALVYLMLWLSVSLPISLGARNDISYGVYIYAMPVQQFLAILGLAAFGWLPFAVLGTVLTIPLALASWFLVERPALRLKNWTPGGTRTPVDLGEPAAAQGDLPLGGPVLTSSREATMKVRTWVGATVMIVALLSYAALMLPGWLIL